MSAKKRGRRLRSNARRVKDYKDKILIPFMQSIVLNAMLRSEIATMQSQPRFPNGGMVNIGQKTGEKELVLPVKSLSNTTVSMGELRPSNEDLKELEKRLKHMQKSGGKS